MILLPIFGMFVVVFAAAAIMLARPELAKLPISWVVVALLLVLLFIVIKGLKTATISTTEVVIKNVFGKRRFYKDDIDYLYLSTEKNGDYRLKFILINGSKRTLFGPYYDNIYAIEEFLQTHYADKIRVRPINEEIIIEPILPGTERKFAGNPHITMFGVFLYLFCIIAPIVLAIRRVENLHWGIISWAMLYFTFGSQLFYFVVTDRKLIVKNHAFPWYNRSYDLANIESISFIVPNSRAWDGLRISKGKSSRFFSAASLKPLDWRKFKKTMESLNVTVAKNDFVL